MTNHPGLRGFLARGALSAKIRTAVGILIFFTLLGGWIKSFLWLLPDWTSCDSTKQSSMFTPGAPKFTVRMVYHAAFPNYKCIWEVTVHVFWSWVCLDVTVKQLVKLWTLTNCLKSYAFFLFELLPNIFSKEGKFVLGGSEWEWVLFIFQSICVLWGTSITLPLQNTSDHQ